jgi:hypothetical protein
MNEPTEYFLVRERDHVSDLRRISMHRREGSNSSGFNLVDYQQVPTMEQGMDRFVHKDDYVEYCNRMGFVV